MRTRHRIPSIFNLSMVDVLCCALGCVILLWLLNLREAKQKAVQAVRARVEATRLHDEGTALARDLEEARARLAELGTRHEALGRQADEARGELGRARRRVTELTGEAEKAGALAATTGRERDEARARGVQLARDLEAARAATAAAEEQLGLRKKEQAELRQGLTASAARVAALEGELKDKRELEKKLAAAGEGMAALRVQFDAQTVARAEAEKKLAGAGERLAALAAQVRDGEAVKKDLTGALGRAEALAAQVKERDARVGELTRQAADLGGRLKDAEARLGEKVKEGGTQATQLAALREEMKGVRQALVREEALARALSKEIGQRTGELESSQGTLTRQKTELDESRRLLDAAHEEKRRLQGEADRFRLAADNRFAGLNLTGRRVLFLVDMSGSMELLDVHTRAPGKWESVRQTVARVMRSLPDLEKFQVILFSEKAIYPLGGEGGWLDSRPDSAGRVLQAVARVKPSGDTDMYTAFSEAFKLRGQGLDTIYLFSDGLPNMGQGLTPEQAKTLKETEQGEILGRYIRRKLQNEWNKEGPGQPKVRINAVGFFFESPDVGAFLWALTRENNGAFVGMSQP